MKEKQCERILFFILILMITKYDIGDSVYYVRDGILAKGVVEEIKMCRKASADWGVVTYYKMGGKITYDYGEEEKDVFLILQDAIIHFERVGKEHLEKMVVELEKKEKPKKKKLKNLIFKRKNER